jgi:hypothetical protein
MVEHKGNAIAFCKALRSISAVKVAEIGTVDSGFIAVLVQETDWTDSMEIHSALMAVNSAEKTDFDRSLTEVGGESGVFFQVTKHEGTEQESLESLMQHAFFDGLFITSAPSSESLLASLMGSNECLKSGGVLGLDHDVWSDKNLEPAISAFKDMYMSSFRILGSDDEQWFEKL